MFKRNSQFYFISKHIVFLLFVFFVQRLLFFLFNFSEFETISILELLLSFTYSLKLDFSTCAFIVIVPFVTSSIERATTIKWLRKIQFYYISLILIILSLIGVANAVLYTEWNSVLSNRALIYLEHPKEIFASLSTLKTLILISILVILTIIFILIYKKFVLNTELTKTKNALNIVLTPLVTLFVLFVMARGGFQLAPANVSSAYFSNNSIVNHITVNPNWYLFADVIESRDNTSYKYYTDKDVDKTLANFIRKDADTTLILSTTKPNIIFIVLESFSANAIGHYGCKENLTPNFDALTKEGIAFDSIYSSGFRTEQGLINIFSGFPAQPNASIITQASKAEKLPSLFSDFKTNGYYTTFYYGGEIEFANIGAYLRLNKLDKISTVKDYKNEQKNSKWGAHDEHLFNKVKSEIATLPQPFFSTLLTLSNHEPFELPNRKKPKEEVEGFKNTVQYTDSCLGNFLSFCKKQSWYNNTLIVIVADHGHRLPYNYSMNMAQAKHIPLLFLGGAIKKEFVATASKKIANQHDIPATLLQQINRNDLANKYIFSQSLLNQNASEYAYFTNENVLGWKQQSTSFSYTFPDKKIYLDKGNLPDSTTIETAKSFLQKVYSTYLNY